MDKALIVAKYNEDTAWTDKFATNGWTVKIINKGPGGDLENIGREPHSYFWYIVNHYKELPNIMLFSQGNPYPHYPSFDTLIHDPLPLGDFRWVGNDFLMCHGDATPQDNLPLAQFYKELFGYDCPSEIHFIPACLFVITKDRIYQHPVEYYERLLELTKVDRNPYIIERLIDKIFE